MNKTQALALSIRNLGYDDGWVVRGESIEWYLDENERPTEEEIQQEFERLQLEYPKEEIKKQRALAYFREADPLFFKYQRGETTKDEWEAKIEEIRQRYPYPS